MSMEEESKTSERGREDHDDARTRAHGHAQLILVVTTSTAHMGDTNQRT